MAEGERQKNKRLLKSFKELALRKKGEELLAVLPQGEGSGLNADMVDGMHAEQIIAEALERIGLPKKGQPTFGGGGMTVHGNEIHTPNFEEYGLSLLLDGSRAMTGEKLLLEPTLKSYLYWTATEYIRHRDNTLGTATGLTLASRGRIHLLGNVYCSGQANFYSFFNMRGTSDATASFIVNNRCVFVGNDVEVARLYGVQDGGNERLGINRAGDITAITGKTLTFPNIIVNSINGVDYTPGSDVDVDLITVNVTGTPKLWWDEATDAFEMNKDLTLPGGSLNLGTATLMDRNGCVACHAFTAIGEAGVAGYLRLAHGTAPTNNEADFLQLYSQVDELYIRTSAGVVETIHTSKKPAILDVDSAEAFLVRKAGDAGDILIVDTVNGRIGINKTPDEWLHIFGNNAAIKLEDNSGNYARIKVGNSQLTFEANPENIFTSTDIVFRLDGFEVARYALYGNFGLKTTQFGGGRGIFAIGNASIIPSGEIDDAGIIYVEAGALKYRGSSGTVTTIAQA